MFRDPQQMAQYAHDHCQQLQREAEDARRANRLLPRDAGARRGSRHIRIRREPWQSAAQR